MLAHAYRVSYALFRIASALPERSFRTHLEDKALDIIVAALEDRRFHLERGIRTSQYLVQFLRDTGHLHADTASIILKEMEELLAAIPAIKNETLPDKGISISVAELFPKDADMRFPETGKTATTPKVAEVNVAPVATEAEHPASDSRRERMLEVIRQSGNSGNPAIGCRLKELQNALPDVSERTIRYDLQRLIENGKIERLGSGGPSTFYRARSVSIAEGKS